MRPRLALGLGLLLLFVTVPFAAGTVGSSAFAGGAQIDPDSVLLGVALQPDGSAEWDIEYRMQLTDDNSTEAFESLRAEIEANRSLFERRFADRMNRTVAAAENATGREMGLEDVTVTVTNATIPQRYGVITYSFVWDGFAAIDGDRLRAGDAIGGLYLDEETTLLIGWPEGYSLTEVAPEPADRRERAVGWAGRFDFSTDQPRVVLGPAQNGTTGGDGDTTGEGTPSRSNPDGSRETIPLAPLAAGAAVLAVLAAAGFLFVRQRGEEHSDVDGDGAEDGDVADDDDGDAPAEALLSNEERVLRLLAERGGRMRQQEVVSELEWTDAKTSQVVGELRDADEIEVFRLGRENVLSLPDRDEP